MMKITRVDIFPLSLDLTGTFKMASTAKGRRGQFTVLRLHTDEGISGLGDCGFASPQHSGESPQTVVAMLRDYLAPQVLGEDPFNIELIHRKMDRVVLGCWLSKAGLDYALHDIMGKALGVPVYQLLGGKSRERVPLGWMVSLDEPKAMAEDAVRGLEAGYGPFLRIKGGTGLTDDVARMRAVRAAVGDEVTISVDFNRVYTPEVAINVIRGMDRYHLDHAEQPVPGWDLTGMARVAAKSAVPIFADDSAWSIEGAMAVIKMNAADGLLLKPTRAGGFHKSRIYAGIAQANNMPLIGASMMGTGVEVAALAHVGVALIKFGDFPNLFQAPLMNYGGYDTRHITERVVTSYPVIKDGHLHVPEGPGLGVELDEGYVRKHLTPGMEVVTCQL